LLLGVEEFPEQLLVGHDAEATLPMAISADLVGMTLQARSNPAPKDSQFKL